MTQEIKKTPAEIIQEMRELGYTYFQDEKAFKKHIEGELIVKTWEEAERFCCTPE